MASDRFRDSDEFSLPRAANDSEELRVSLGGAASAIVKLVKLLQPQRRGRPLLLLSQTAIFCGCVKYLKGSEFAANASQLRAHELAIAGSAAGFGLALALYELYKNIYPALPARFRKKWLSPKIVGSVFNCLAWLPFAIAIWLAWSAAMAKY
jgi:hypothetical protein